MSFGKGQNQSTSQGSSASQSYLDPTNEASQLANVQRANSLLGGYSPYTGQLTASLNPTQQQFFGALDTLAGAGTGTGALNTAVNAATGVSGYAPQQVAAGQLSTTNLQPYLNPYTSDVINSSMNLLNQQLGQTQQQNAASATASGAYDNDRLGLQNALTNEYGQLAAGQTISNLENQGYTNAQQAAQADLQSSLQAELANQQAGLSGQGLNLSAANALGSLGPAQFNLASNQAGLLGQSGYAQQAAQQTGDTNSYNAWLQNLQNLLGLSGTVNQAYGTLGNPTLSSSASQNSAQSTGDQFNLGFKWPGGS
jgi:hypothetical protein